ncbi:MAG TPA: hypothetical protein VH165_33845, partial [Kofleriaceae bacterium]|nr:hypothetical protein [Kofleriaceae bacterium]
ATGTGSAAAPAAGTGSAVAPATGTGSAAAPATTAPATPKVIEASKDVLPAMGTVARPTVSRIGPSPRQAKMPGVGGSKDAINALFDELAPGAVARTLYEGDAGAYVLIQLIARAQPKVDEFDKTADAEIARMTAARAHQAEELWLKDRCDTLVKAGKIKPSAEKIRETDDKGNPAPTVYRPCMFFEHIDQ